MPIEKEVIISHVTGAEHPKGIRLEGVNAVSFAHTNKAVPLADAERTPESDIIGCSGSVLFRNLRDADQFLRNPKADLKVTGLLRGQVEPVTVDVVNCKAQSFAPTTMGEAPGPFSTQQVAFLADSWSFARGVG